MRELIGKPLQIDAFDLLGQIPDKSINLIFADPPYNIGIFCKMPPDEYMDWCKAWIDESDRVLTNNGAFWVCHKDPDILIELSQMITAKGRKRINWITWDKFNKAGNLRGFLDGYTVIDSIRSFQVMAEYLIYHADDGDWERATGQLWSGSFEHRRGFIFEPLRSYLVNEWRRAGLKFSQANEACGTASMAAHYFSRSQWCLPTEEHYNSLQRYANTNGTKYLRKEYEDLRKEYEDLRKEYEDLRKEYEDLRYTFNNPGLLSSVWQIAPAERNDHPTPKPLELLTRIIESTTNEGDIILDFFAGSFTSAIAAQRLGRLWICGDINKKWVELGKRLLKMPYQLVMEL